jgi:hypothetical protein
MEGPGGIGGSVVPPGFSFAVTMDGIRTPLHFGDVAWMVFKDRPELTVSHVEGKRGKTDERGSPQQKRRTREEQHHA